MAAKKKESILFLLFAFFLTTALSILCIWLFRSQSNFDTRSYEIIGNLTLKGENIYPDPAISRHPYFPLFLYAEAGALVLSTLFHTSQTVVLKLFFLVFHLFSVFCIYKLTKCHRLKTILYAINPISLGVTFFHGQFDIIPLSLLLFALITLSKKRFVLTLILLSIAITIKSWPALFAIPYLRRVPKKYWILLLPFPLFFLLFYSLLFHAYLFSILRVLVVYQGVNGIWGFGKIISLVVGDNKLVFILYKLFFLFGFSFFSMKLKKTKITDELLFLFLVFFVFTPGFGIQWLLWPVPFLFFLSPAYAILIYSDLSIPVLIGYLFWIPQLGISTKTVDVTFLSQWILILLLLIVFNIAKRRSKHIF